MAVRIRMKKMGRRHRPFFRICAVDSRGSRDGKVIEYLGHYDPMLPETDARAVLKSERIDYWLRVGARPSDKVSVLIKKYGTDGTHLEQQQAALQRLESSKPQAPLPMAIPRPQPDAEEAEEVAAAGTEESDAETAAVTAGNDDQAAEAEAEAEEKKAPPSED